MINKIRITVDESDRIMRQLPLIVQIRSVREFEAALILLKNHSHPLKGIELCLSLAREIDLSPKDISYLSIHLDEELTEKEIEGFLGKNRFVEVFLPERFYHCLKLCRNAGRIVLEAQDKSAVQSYFSDMISMAKFPIVKNMPFCHTSMEHCYEFYENSNLKTDKNEFGDADTEEDRSKKPLECASCLFIKNCPGPSSFIPKPILDFDRCKQALEFVNNEDTIARF